MRTTTQRSKASGIYDEFYNVQPLVDYYVKVVEPLDENTPRTQLAVALRCSTLAQGALI